MTTHYQPAAPARDFINQVPLLALRAGEGYFFRRM